MPYYNISLKETQLYLLDVHIYAHKHRYTYTCIHVYAYVHTPGVELKLGWNEMVCHRKEPQFGCHPLLALNLSVLFSQKS